MEPASPADTMEGALARLRTEELIGFVADRQGLSRSAQQKTGLRKPPPPPPPLP